MKIVVLHMLRRFLLMLLKRVDGSAVGLQLLAGPDSFRTDISMAYVKNYSYFISLGSKGRFTAHFKSGDRLRQYYALTIYPDEYANSNAQSNVASIAFAGTVVGHLFFGWVADWYSRKWALMATTVVLIIFAILGAGSYGAGGSIGGLLAALTAYRFFLGIRIGGGYPAGSVACAESTGELKRGHRNRW